MENSIANQIDQLIESVPQPKTPLMQRLKAWWVWRSLPRGQRLLKMGFKAINMAQLEERFSLKALNEKKNDALINQALAQCGLTRDEVIIRSVEDFSSVGSIWVKWTEKKNGKDGLDKVVVPISRSRTKIEAVVKIVPLNRYIGDEIPARCMADVKRAKSLGLGKMYVAYPAFNEIPDDDPIIICKWDGSMGGPNSTFLEVSWWE